MPKIKVNDINIFYETFGQGQPLVLVTGFSADRLIWQGIVDAYAKHYQVIIVDNRGSGLSDSPDIPYTIEMMADDIVALCKALSLDRCHFMGTSMGGAIVQTLAYKYPQLCRSAIIVNSMSKIDIRFVVFAKGRYELIKAGGFAQAQLEMALGIVFSNNYLNKPGIIETFITAGLASPHPMTAVGYKNQLSALLGFDSAGWLHKIKVPCLVTGSDQDGIATEANMRSIAEQIPGALYYCFKGVGHLPFIEKPEEFNKMALAFLKYND